MPCAVDLEVEEDTGRWCYCKERKGGDMVGCDNKKCTIHMDTTVYYCFTWSVYKWLKLLKENGTALHAMQLAQIRKQKSNRL